jgi:SP family sugar:H+ symporter-like MFS transporter
VFLVLSEIHNIAFIERFGTYNPKTKKFVISPKNLSLLNSLPRITFGLGIVMGGLLGESFGRRPVYILMLLICEIGTIISYFAKNFAQILAGRMLNQMYIGMEGWLVPMFHAEIIPAPIRGAVVVGYVFNHIFGSFIMSCITFKTSQWDTDHCWQIPVAVMFILPTIALALCWFVPESPRWLLRKGKDEKALKMMRYIYGSNPEYAPEQEMALLKASLEIEEEKGTWKELVVGTNFVSINTSSKVLKFVPQY